MELETKILCMYCGDAKQSFSEEHFPPKCMFDEKYWPKNFVFDNVCSRCNSKCGEQEIRMAFASRIMPSIDGTIQREEFQKYLKALSKKDKKFLEELWPEPEQIRKGFEYLEQEIPRNLNNHNFINAGGKLFKQTLRMFAFRQTASLHYLYTNQLIAPNGAAVFRFYTNLEVIKGKIPREMSQILLGAPPMRRGKHQVNDQFHYLRNATEDGNLGLYLCFYRNSFVLLCAAFTDKNRVRDIIPQALAEDIVTRLQWDSMGRYVSKPDISWNYPQEKYSASSL